MTLDPGEPESDRGAQKDFTTQRGGWGGGQIIAREAAAFISVVTGLPLEMNTCNPSLAVRHSSGCNNANLKTCDRVLSLYKYCTVCSCFSCHT